MEIRLPNVERRLCNITGTQHRQYRSLEPEWWEIRGWGGGEIELSRSVNSEEVT